MSISQKELESYSDNDLELIIRTQQDLYSQDELSVFQNEIIRRKQQYEADKIKRIPKNIQCEKCDGINSFDNDCCIFCGVKLDKRKYYTDEYYEKLESVESDNSGDKENYLFQYIISFIIPLVGFILGGCLLTKDNDKEKGIGKSCIIIGIASMIITLIVYCVLTMI